VSASNAFETDLLEHILQNADIPNIGDATGLRGSSTAGSLYIGLHTADPGETGNQTTSETSFSNYVRMAVARSGAGWTVSGNNGSNAAAITFAQCGAVGATITHFSVGTASSGSGYLIFKGALDASLAVSNGITPSFAPGNLDINAE